MNRSRPLAIDDFIGGEPHALRKSIEPLFQLIRLSCQRAIFRARRTAGRMISPKRFLASSLVLLFLSLYGVSGVMVFMTRPPANPQHLRLWLSGGMVLYTIYHATKLAWRDKAQGLDLSAAEWQWIIGSPLSRWLVAVYAVMKLLPATLVKSGLLAMVLMVDVRQPWLLMLAIFLSLMLLEIGRITLVRIAAALSPRRRIWFRVIASSVMAAIVIQMVSRVIAAVPLGSSPLVYLANSFTAVGHTASCQVVQWFSLPWHPMVNLSVASQLDGPSLVWLAVSLATLPAAIAAFVWVDRVCAEAEKNEEANRLAAGRFQGNGAASEIAGRSASRSASRRETLRRCIGPLAWFDPDAAAVAHRAAQSVTKYRGTILMSFLVPFVLCLSPLLTKTIDNTWLFVVGGLAMCTAMLAPSSLRIDFRRDLSRMVILRSLPIRPLSMVMGQLYFPVAITCLFQWSVLAIAAVVLCPGWDQMLFWSGLLMAFAVFTFALENTLFLAFPHLDSDQGIAMVIRSKLTFLGKSCLIAFAFVALAIWSTLCRNHLPDSVAGISTIAGSLVAAWMIAATMMAVTAWCWKQFDISAQRATG